jgi:hypothetical protein
MLLVEEGMEGYDATRRQHRKNVSIGLHRAHERRMRRLRVVLFGNQLKEAWRTSENLIVYA